MFCTGNERRYVSTLPPSRLPAVRAQTRAHALGLGKLEFPAIPLLSSDPVVMATSGSAVVVKRYYATLEEAAADLGETQASLVERQARIRREIAANEAVLAALKTKNKGRSGRYNSADKKKKNTADTNLKYLRDGKLPEEARQERMAEHERMKNAPKPAASAASHAAHHAAASDGRHRGGGAAAAASAAGGQAAVDAAARGGGPDDEENAELPEGVDKRYFSASDAQRAFLAEVLPDALNGRGGRHLGSGYYCYSPLDCVELGGDMSTVGVSELIIFDPNRAFGCGHGCCPKHGWVERKHINTAGLTRKSRRERRGRSR